MVVKGGIRVFFIMWRTISLSLLSVVCMFGATGALADIASAGYVQEIVDSLRVQSDWMQTNPDALDYIKNKPINHEIVDNKVTVLSADVTDEQYPSARAVHEYLTTKADADDVRFNTIPTSQPAGTPPAGQVFIWFN